MSRATTESRTDEVRDAAVAVLTTVDAIGRLVSGPVARQGVDPDGDLWLLAGRDSREVAHIIAVPEVSVTVTSKDTRVSIHGLAAVVDDPAKARDLGNGWAEAWPPDVVLVKVTAMSAEYRDASGDR